MYTHDITKKNAARNKKPSFDFTDKKLVEFLSREENLHYPEVIDIDPLELAEKLDDVVIVDVRHPDEFHGELGHIPGAHLSILDELEDHLHRFPKDKTVAFVCRSGGRSARACMLALHQGFTNIVNLKGGMILWNEHHLPTEA